MDATATGTEGTVTPRIAFERRAQFAWKTALLLATTVALIPILLLKDAWAAQVYLVALVAVHLVGLAIIAIGVKRTHIAPDRRGLVIRLVGIAFLVSLLYVASKGLRTSTEDLLFWGSLFAIWALHTLGLALLHVRSGREAAACPFV
ncbi:MAG TPA: hypothetical protein VM327_01595 [Candidatus Thermoplasmatota archaeon]|nr:hypothetical protein [Candidatus Thermoplasmatota archaeon]